VQQNKKTMNLPVNNNLENIKKTQRVIPRGSRPPADPMPLPKRFSRSIPTPVHFPPEYQPRYPQKGPWTFPNILVVLVPPIGFFPWKHRPLPKPKVPATSGTIPESPALTETPKTSEQQNQVGSKKEEKKDENLLKELEKILGKFGSFMVRIDELFKSTTFWICLGVVAAIVVSYIIPQFLGIPV